MPNLTTSSAIDTFMGSANNAAALANLGAAPLAGATFTGNVIAPLFAAANGGDKEAEYRTDYLGFSDSANSTSVTLYPNSSGSNVIITLPNASGTLQTTNTIPATIQLACSDETTPLTTGLKVTFRMPYGMTLTSMRASLTTAPTVSSVIVNVKESGASVLSSLLTISTGSKTSTTTAISDSSLADDSEITIEITQSGGVAAGLKLTLIGTRL